MVGYRLRRKVGKGLLAQHRSTFERLSSDFIDEIKKVTQGSSRPKSASRREEFMRSMKEPPQAPPSPTPGPAQAPTPGFFGRLFGRKTDG